MSTPKKPAVSKAPAQSAPRKALLLGRNPAALLGLIEAVLALVGGFWTGLDAEHVSLIMAVLAAGFSLYTAFATKETTLAVIIGLIKAVIALGIGYGLHITQDQTGLLIAVVTTAFGLINHQLTDGPDLAHAAAESGGMHVSMTVHGKHEAPEPVVTDGLTGPRPVRKNPPPAI